MEVLFKKLYLKRNVLIFGLRDDYELPLSEGDSPDSCLGKVLFFFIRKNLHKFLKDDSIISFFNSHLEKIYLESFIFKVSLSKVLSKIGKNLSLIQEYESLPFSDLEIEIDFDNEKASLIYDDETHVFSFEDFLDTSKRIFIYGVFLILDNKVSFKEDFLKELITLLKLSLK